MMFNKLYIIFTYVIYMFNSYVISWQKAFKFKGRSTRKEYWLFQFTSLFWIILFLILSSFQTTFSNFQLSADNFETLYQLFAQFISLISFIPFFIIIGSLWVVIPLTVRRIRDVGMNWQWIFVALLPYFGLAFTLIFLTRTSILEIDGKKYYLKN